MNKCWRGSYLHGSKKRTCTGESWWWCFLVRGRGLNFWSNRLSSKDRCQRSIGSWLPSANVKYSWRRVSPRCDHQEYRLRCPAQSCSGPTQSQRHSWWHKSSSLPYLWYSRAPYKCGRAHRGTQRKLSMKRQGPTSAVSDGRWTPRCFCLSSVPWYCHHSLLRPN